MSILFFNTNLISLVKKMGGFNVQFNIPSNMLIVGPTSSGKTTWLKQLTQHRYNFFSETPQTMILFYKEPQKAYNDLETSMRFDEDGKEIKKSFPTFSKFKEVPKSIEGVKDILETYPRKIPKIVVFDDYLDEVGSVLKHFFTVLTHHYNCFTVFLSQNLFDKRSDLRTLSINAQYMILFNNPRDRSAITQLAKQIFPGQSRLLNTAYQEAVGGRSYGYMLLDFHQRQDDRIRLRSHIFPKEWPMKTYISI